MDKTRELSNNALEMHPIRREIRGMGTVVHADNRSYLGAEIRSITVQSQPGQKPSKTPSHTIS
jgi:hypothetical protein